jgi:hypothetical protein
MSSVAVSLGLRAGAASTSSGLQPAPRCDCSICPFFVDNPAAVERICSGCNSDCSYCGCARAEAAAPSGACRTCPIRCGSRTDIGAWMADVGGTLTFDDIDPGQYPFPPLPPFVPMLDAVAAHAEVDPGLGWPAYAIGLRRVFSLKTHRLAAAFESASASEVLGLRPGQLSVLVGYGEDPLVESFYTLRRSAGLLDGVARMGWDLVLSPNYSMYGNQPRAEHLLNFRRNLLAAAEMVAAGIPAAPNLYWFRVEDLKRIVAWVADTAPVAVAVNCQTFRTEADWSQMLLPGLTFLAASLVDLDMATRIVVCGTSRADRLGQLSALFGERLVVISQNAMQYARRGAVMTAAGREDRHALVADAFAANVRFYSRLLHRGEQ